MSVAYTPTPGSVAFRAIAWLELQPAGAEFMGAKIAEAIGIEPAALRGSMQGALDAGLVFARKKGGAATAPLFWSLVDHGAKPASTPVEKPEVMNGCASPVSAAGDGSQTPNGGHHGRPVKAGSELPRAGLRQVLKAERESADATDRETPATRSPVGGPTGVGQAAAAAPAGRARRIAACALWSSGEFAIELEDGEVILAERDKAREIVAFLAGRQSA